MSNADNAGQKVNPMGAGNLIAEVAERVESLATQGVISEAERAGIRGLLEDLAAEIRALKAEDLQPAEAPGQASAPPEDVLPCPFCGCEAEVVYDGDAQAAFPFAAWVQCMGADCAIESEIQTDITREGARASALAAWNRRIYPAQTFADAERAQWRAECERLRALVEPRPRIVAPGDSFVIEVKDYPLSPLTFTADQVLEILTAPDAGEALHAWALGEAERGILEAEIERLRPFAERADKQAAELESRRIALLNAESVRRNAVEGYDRVLAISRKDTEARQAAEAEAERLRKEIADQADAIVRLSSERDHRRSQCEYWREKILLERRSSNFELTSLHAQIETERLASAYDITGLKERIRTLEAEALKLAGDLSGLKADEAAQIARLAQEREDLAQKVSGLERDISAQAGRERALEKSRHAAGVEIFELKAKIRGLERAAAGRPLAVWAHEESPLPAGTLKAAIDPAGLAFVGDIKAEVQNVAVVIREELKPETEKERALWAERVVWLDWDPGRSLYASSLIHSEKGAH